MLPLLLFSSSPFLLFFPLFLCGVSLGIAYSVRGLAAIVAPVPLLLLLIQAVGERKHKREGDAKTTTRFAPLLVFVAGLILALLPYALLWYVPHHQEIARVNAYYVHEQLLPHNVREWMRNVARGLWDWQRGMLPYLLKHSPVLLLAAILRAWQKRGRQGADTGYSLCELYLWGWLLLISALTLSVNYAPSRYYVLFYPPLAGLAALTLNSVSDMRVSSVKPLQFRNYRMLLCLFGVSWIVGNGYWHADWLLHLSYRQRNADSWLASHLPVGSVLIGAVSPGLSLDNRFRCVNVIEGLCNDKHPIEQAAPAPRYILILDQNSVSDTASNQFDSRTNRWKERYWLRAYPDLVRPERRIMAFPDMLRPFFTIGVYPVPDGYLYSRHREAKGSEQSMKVEKRVDRLKRVDAP